jgi:hypothetical protein
MVSSGYEPYEAWISGGHDSDSEGNPSSMRTVEPSWHM